MFDETGNLEIFCTCEVELEVGIVVDPFSESDGLT